VPFSYESYQALIQSLGDADGLAATITLAALRLREEATASGDPTQFIVSEAQRLGINTGGMNFDRFENSATQLLLVGVFQQEEAFLDDFRRERAAMGLRFPPKSNNESSLRHALRSLNGGFSLNRKRVREDHFELIEYYRHLRNTFVHSEFDNARLAPRYQEVSKFRSSIQKEYELNAPNEFSKLSGRRRRLARKERSDGTSGCLFDPNC